MVILFVILADRCIPYDFIEPYLNHDDKLNEKGILNKIESLEFWRFKPVKRCISCGIDLVWMTPITRRFEVIYTLPCCELLLCRPCYVKALQEKLYQCHYCDTAMEVDTRTSASKVDIEIDEKQHATNRNYFHKIQNQLLTTKADLPWLQPGSFEYGIS